MICSKAPAFALSQSIITNINFVKFTLFYKVSQRLRKRRDTERHLCISFINAKVLRLILPRCGYPIQRYLGESWTNEQTQWTDKQTSSVCLFKHVQMLLLTPFCLYSKTKHSYGWLSPKGRL